jgi:hypothetical protein
MDTESKNLGHFLLLKNRTSKRNSYCRLSSRVAPKEINFISIKTQSKLINESAVLLKATDVREMLKNIDLKKINHK